jgi:hypothetical protein
MVEYCLIENAWPGLDSRPFHRQAIGIQAELLDKSNIFPPAIPRSASVT